MKKRGEVAVALALLGAVSALCLKLTGVMAIFSCMKFTNRW